MADPTTVTDATFEAEVIKADTPVLVDFWAAWCGPCRAIAPLVEEIAGEYVGKVKVAKLDVDANPVIPGQFGVMSIPTLMIFRDGKAVDRIVGYMPKDKLTRAVDSALA